MEKKNILVICNSLCYPSVEMSGMSAIYNLFCEVASTGKFGVHIVSSLPSWGSQIENRKNLTFYYVKSDDLLLTRLKMIQKALRFNEKCDLIHDFSSLIGLAGFTGLLSKRINCSAIHTLVTVNTSVLGSSRLLWGASKVNFLSVDKITDLRIKSKKVYSHEYIPLGIRTSDFDIKRLPNDQSILFLGSLENRKGAYVLASAINRIRSEHSRAVFTFASYGREVRDPNYPKNLERIKNIIGNKTHGVTFLMGKHNVPELLSRNKIFVLPTTSRNGTLGQPITLMEAMASGCVCVVSDIHKGDGLAVDGFNCLLFRSKDYKDLANKIAQVLSDTELSRRLSDNAKNYVRENFDIKVTSSKVITLYESLI